MQNLDEAYRMLDAFASVGARHFDVTFLDIDGAKRGFRRDQSVLQLRNSLPKLLPGLTERQNSLVVRPQSDETVALVQLDDLDSVALERVKPISFLTVCTSAGNHQAWVAVDHIAGAGKMIKTDISRRLRKGTGADLSASGASRLAGTVNYKCKYEPNFPTITVVDAHPGRIVTPDQLEQFGLLAADEPERRQPAPARVSRSGSWPDYQRCVQGAPPNRGNTGPDISRADFMWSLMALRRGHSIEDTAARLAELSSKAQENGDGYALMTAQNAAATVDRELQRSRA